MSRPCKMRRVACGPQVRSFKPCGGALEPLEEVVLTVDELEAIRLADLEEMYQEQAAKAMNVSRQTFGNIIASARKKTAEFLLRPRVLLIDGGHVEMQTCGLVCDKCQHTWTVPCGAAFPENCPECKSGTFYCVKKSDGNNKHKCWRSV